MIVFCHLKFKGNLKGVFLPAQPNHQRRLSAPVPASSFRLPAHRASLNELEPTFYRNFYTVRLQNPKTTKNKFIPNSF